MKKTTTAFVLALTLMFVPALSFAQTGSSPSGGGTPSTLGGSSPFDFAPGNGAAGYVPPEAPPVTGGTPTGTGPSSTSGQSAYCNGATSTINLSESKVGDLLKFVTCLIEQSVMPLLFALALAVFIWGIVKFISTEGAAEKEQGRQFMIWGVIAFFVMFSVWGLVRILGDTFGLSNTIPTVTEHPQ